MGRKRSGARQLVYFLSAGLMLSILLGCLPEMRRVAVQKEPAIPNLQEEQSAGDNPWEALQRARRLFRQGDFEASFKENQKALEWAGENFPADRALFNMGVIYAHGANPKKDPGKSLGYFRRVAEEFPESPLAEESQAWIGLLQKNLNLAKDLVDLTQENVSLIQENAMALNQENARLSQMAERHQAAGRDGPVGPGSFSARQEFFRPGQF